MSQTKKAPVKFALDDAVRVRTGVTLISPTFLLADGWEKSPSCRKAIRRFT